MLITIPNKYNIPEYTFKYKLLRNALLTATCFSFGVDGLLLDAYLKEEYSIGLRAACKKLIQKATVEFRGNECVVYFADKTYDTLARLITYGTVELKGIPILRKMFTMKG